MTKTLFLRLLEYEDKASGLQTALASIRAGMHLESVVYSMDVQDFHEIPKSAFAYWLSESLRRIFTELPSFQGEDRSVRAGLATRDDFRFVRAWWEVPESRVLDASNNSFNDVTDFQRWCLEQTLQGKYWVPFAKGGEFSPYYADLYLVVNWSSHGKGMKLRNPQFNFLPGLTWTLRTHRLAVQPLPAGSITSMRGSGVYADRHHLPVIAALFNSTCFDFLVKVFLGRFNHPQFDVGVLPARPFQTIFSQTARG